jgi:hypothetical protein
VRDTLVNLWTRRSEIGRAGGAARAQCEVRIFRAGQEEAEAEAGALFWDRIPVAQRAEFVWNLSVEIHGLAHPESAKPTAFADVRCDVIGLDDLLVNKRAAARLQDLADVDALERLRKARRR